MLSSNCEIVTILHDNKKLSLTIDFRVIDVTDLNSEEMTNYIKGLRNENIN